MTSMAMPRSMPYWGEFAEALAWAAELHSTQSRKGTEVPYIAHPIAVASLVLEDGGGKHEAIAALLHDVIEDCRVTPEEITDRFGARVARIVGACTDNVPGEARGPETWRARKERHVAHLGAAPRDVLRVSLADKVHNARSIASDVMADGSKTLERFNGGIEGTRWYYRELVEAFAKTKASRRLLRELRRSADVLLSDAPKDGAARKRVSRFVWEEGDIEIVKEGADARRDK